MLKIDQREYEISEKLAPYAANFLLDEYKKLDENWQFLAKPFARAILQKMEQEARKKDQDWIVFRPEKKSDAVIHLIHVFGAIIQKVVTHASIELTTEHNTVTAVEIKNQAGRQVGTDGNIGIRENDSIKVS